jgi:prepilin-type processing-associated H-X9-DG protein
LALLLYQNDHDGRLPTCYTYINGASSGPLVPGGPAGYIHWTGVIYENEYADPTEYPVKQDQFVCPSHPPLGFAPTNFTTDRIPDPPAGQVTQTAGIDDIQAPRLSYCANELMMPRKKFAAWYDNLGGTNTAMLTLVNPDFVTSPDQTILMGEFAENANGIYGSSIGGGFAYKSHRPASAVEVGPDVSGNSYGSEIFDGEKYDQFIGNGIHMLTPGEAQEHIDQVLKHADNGPVAHHVSYINPQAHTNGSNYLFVDGHAGRNTLEETLDPQNFLWGRKVWSVVDKPKVQRPLDPPYDTTTWVVP